MKKAAGIKLPLQAFGLTEGSDHGGGVLVLGIDGVVEATLNRGLLVGSP